MTPKRDVFFYYIIVSLCFFLVRFSTFPYVFIDNFINLIDPDSYYHLRRVLYTLHNFPKMLNFDPFLSYPFGDYSPWPPLYDFISASIVKILGENLNIIPFLNPFYFFIALSILYFSLVKKEGQTVALTYSFMLSLIGILYLYTSYGRFDHHALELLIITIIYLTFQRYYNLRDIFSLIIFSIFTTLSFLNWPGSLIYFVPIFIFISFEFIKGRLNNGIFKGLFIAFHLAAITITIYLKTTKTGDFPPYSYKFLSAFHRDLCFFISILFITLYFHRVNRINKIALWIINSIILVIMFHNLFYEILKGVMFITKSDALMILVEESSPLFFSKFYSLKEEILRANSLFTLFIFIWPYLIYRYYKKRGTDILFFYSLFFSILTLFQLRFGYFMMMGYALIISINFKEVMEKRQKLFIFLFIILSVITFFKDVKTSSERFIGEDLRNSLFFLRDNTPEKERFKNGETPYGILASWHLGHHIIEVAKRPAVAHNFINVALKNGEREFIKALFSKKEEEVLSILDKNKSRFLLLENPEENIVTDWSVLSKEKNPFLKDDRTLNPTVSTLFIFNLYHFYGLTPPFTNSPKHLRLVYESSSKKNNIKIFERVKSAKVIYKGKGKAMLKILVKTPFNSFYYINLGEPVEGGWSFTVPYSIDAPYDVKADFVSLEVDGNKINLNITEKDILEGSIIELK